MNLTIEVKVDRVRLRQLEGAPKLLDAGQRRAINRAATRLRAQAVKRIAARVNLKSGYLREKLELYKAGPNRPFGSVVGRARGTRLDRFPHRQVTRSGKTARKNAGVAVRVKRGNSARTIKSAFRVPLRSGRTDGAGGFGIAVRTSLLAQLGIDELPGAQGGSGKRRYQVLYSLSVAQLLRQEIERSNLDEEIRAYYADQLDKELRRAVARLRA